LRGLTRDPEAKETVAHRKNRLVTYTFRKIFFMKPIVIISFSALLCLLYSCKPVPHVTGDPVKEARQGMDTASSIWGTWNVLFKPGTDRNKRSQALLDVENALIDQFNSLNPRLNGYRINFRVFYCVCDSLLYNIDAQLLNGNGESVTSPPPPPPSGGSGDVQFVSFNNKMVDVDDSLAQVLLPDSIRKDYSLTDRRPTKLGSQILAVIDTGLDTTFFSSEILRIIWRDDGAPTIFSVINPSGTGLLMDDHLGKHGTVVTGLALQALKENVASLAGATGNENILPRIMSIKALDKDKRGSTFTVSCALSYAIQHHAALVNASLGYYGSAGLVDSVFRHYVNLCGEGAKPITIFAAAGNIPGGRLQNQICLQAPPGNALSPSRMFYPACFSLEFNHVLAITGLKDTHSSCYYQNYSSTYVSLGVKPDAVCCHFGLPFAMGEGTSFATPVATGTSLGFILNGHAVSDFLAAVSRETTPPVATKDGKYITANH
jgi:hypothetical protein